MGEVEPEVPEEAPAEPEEPKDDVIEAEEEEAGVPEVAQLDVTKVVEEAQARYAKMQARGRIDADKTYSGYVVALQQSSGEAYQKALSDALRAEAERRTASYAEASGPYARGRLAAKVVAGEYDA